MKLFSRIEGEGKPFLILHGLFGMSDNWSSLAKRWAQDCGVEVHMLDMRNHGQSPHSDTHSYEAMAEDVLEYMRDRGFESAIIMGHSMGGKVAMHLATMEPSAVEKLCVVDIAPKSYPVHHQEIIDAMRTLDFSILKSRKEADDKLAESMPNFAMRQFLLKSLYWESEGVLGWRFNLDAIEANIEMVGLPLNERAYYSGPTTFIRGALSNYVKDTDFDLILNHFPTTKFITIPNAGHWVHSEQPQLMFDAICEFLG